MKWTRKRYERARRLARLLNRLPVDEKPTPRVVGAYDELMDPVRRQIDHMDPNNGWHYNDIRWRLNWFKRKKHFPDDDEIPF